MLLASISWNAGAVASPRGLSGSETSAASCTALRSVRSYGVKPDGATTTRGAPGSAFVQEYAAPGGTTLAALTLPDGFNPATATDATLTRFHLPPRPQDPGARANWLELYGRPVHQTAPSSAPCLTNAFGATAANSTIWSGRVVARSGINNVTGRWTQPNFVAYCLHASTRFIWDGIGGYGTNKLIQAGSYTTDTSGSNINTVSAAVEVYPLEAIVTVSSPAIRTGDTVNIQTTYSSSSSGTATWTFKNQTTGVTAVWYQTGVSSYYDGTHGEYIDERATKSDGTQYLLRKSTNITYWGSEYVNGIQSNSLTTINVTMKATDVLMTAIMGATTSSSETWKDCGPSSGTNQ
jgi:Peptidase A4 family